jgi:hypothetical protein
MGLALLCLLFLSGGCYVLRSRSIGVNPFPNYIICSFFVILLENLFVSILFWVFNCYN